MQFGGILELVSFAIAERVSAFDWSTCNCTNLFFYVVLSSVDGTFCQAALQTKINIKEQLPKYLDGSIQLCILICLYELVVLKLLYMYRYLKEFGNLKFLWVVCGYSPVNRNIRNFQLKVNRPISISWNSA